MLVRLRVFGSLSRYLGGTRQEVELSTGATLRDLLNLVDAQWGRELPSRFWSEQNKRFQGPVLIMSEGVDLYDEDTPLWDQQEIMLLVPLSAG
jgi:molybdopterin converting factor small subunit